MYSQSTARTQTRRRSRPHVSDDQRSGSFRVHNRLPGQFLGHIARVRERLLGETDRPLDEVVLELDADLTQVVADRRVLPDGDEPAVALDVDVLDAGARQLLRLTFAPDRAAAIPGE